jgi:hypothetical protein
LFIAIQLHMPDWQTWMQSLWLRKLPQTVNSKTTAFIDQVMLLELQNGPFLEFVPLSSCSQPIGS